MFFWLFGEVKFADSFKKGSVEGESVFKISNEVLDEVFSVLNFLSVQVLEESIDAHSFSLTNTSGLNVLFEFI